MIKRITYEIQLIHVSASWHLIITEKDACSEPWLGKLGVSSISNKQLILKYGKFKTTLMFDEIYFGGYTHGNTSVFLYLSAYNVFTLDY